MDAAARPISFSNRLAANLRARNIHYGWAVIAATFLTMLATAGAMGSAGVMIGPLQQEFGWSNADISSALAVRLVLYGLMGPFAAAFMNRFGVRKVVTAALIMISVGLLGSLLMREVWQLVLLWGVIVGLGTGTTALVLGATVATRWFSARRGLVVGMLTASNATGQLIFLPLLASLSTALGWRAALIFVLAVLMLALAAGHAADAQLSERCRPAGLWRDRAGAAPGAAAWPRHAADVAAGRAARGCRHPYFLGAVPHLLCLRAQHQRPDPDPLDLAVRRFRRAAGRRRQHAGGDRHASISPAPSRSGWLSDRYDNRWLLFMFYSLRGLSLIYLPFSDFNFYSLSIFAVFYGLDWVATVPPTVKLAAERFGRERASLTFGWIFAGHQLGAATAAFGAGATRTEFATYLPALYIAGTFCLFAALLVMTLGRRANPTPAAA